MLKVLPLGLVCLFVTATGTWAEMFVQERAEEAAKLEASRGAAERVGDAITLRLNTGETLTWRNGTQCSDERGAGANYGNCFWYVFIDHYAAQHAYLVAKMYQEGYSYEWIDDRTGQTTRLEDAPHFSPSGDRFVIVRANEIEGYSGVQIWGCPDGKPVKEWDFEPTEAGANVYALYTFQSWEGEDAVSLRAEGVVDRKDRFSNLPVQLIRSPEWVVKGLPQPSRR